VVQPPVPDKPAPDKKKKNDGGPPTPPVVGP